MKGGDNMNNVLMAFLLTLLAGLATGIGSCIAFFAKKTNKKFLCKFRFFCWSYDLCFNDRNVSNS